MITVFNTKITSSYQEEEEARYLVSGKNNKETPVMKIHPNANYLLHKNLKHLEFINFLESHYNSKDLNQFPVDFLQSFQNIKTQAQYNTLNLIKSRVV